MHVLLSDREAEHVPGCNMGFWRERLAEVGGFDPQFRIAGDDVDLCWRIHEHGWTIGFSPAALVWHRRRNSVRAFLRQQRGYGEAEALLERKWPEKYNRSGHVTWNGRVYGEAATRLGRWRVYYGTWGASLFQSLYEPAPGLLRSLPLMPEWHLLVGALAAASVLDVALGPLVVAPFVGVPLTVLLLALAVAAPAAHALRAGWKASREPKVRALAALLHLLQPVARLAGRVRGGLTPWRRRAPALAVPAVRSATVWSEQWRPPSEWLGSLERELRHGGAVVRRGGDYDRWDLEVRGGALATARLRFGLEEHGEGKQLARFRIWPRCSRAGLAVVLGAAAAAAGAAATGSLAAAGVLGLLAALTLARMAGDAAAAVGTLLAGVRRQAEEAPDLLTVLDEQVTAARGQRALQPAGAGSEAGE